MSRLAQGVHMRSVIKPVAAGQHRIDLEPAQVVRHEQAPVNVVVIGLRQIVEHLVSDDKHLTVRRDTEPTDIVCRQRQAR